MAAASPERISIERYRHKAAGYDASAQRTMPLRRRTIALLRQQPGQCVLDVGAGTGLSYPLLREAVGDTGLVLGCEQSPDMFALAEDRVRREGWRNVWHANESAERVRLPRTADAVLFNYVHDVSRSPAAVRNLLQQVRPGAHVAMAGMKFFPLVGRGRAQRATQCGLCKRRQALRTALLGQRALIEEARIRDLPTHDRIDDQTFLIRYDEVLRVERQAKATAIELHHALDDGSLK